MTRATRLELGRIHSFITTPISQENSKCNSKNKTLATDVTVKPTKIKNIRLKASIQTFKVFNLKDQRTI